MSAMSLCLECVYVSPAHRILLTIWENALPGWDNWRCRAQTRFPDFVLTPSRPPVLSLL